jgi:hypothetical protein
MVGEHLISGTLFLAILGGWGIFAVKSCCQTFAQFLDKVFNENGARHNAGLMIKKL